MPSALTVPLICFGAKTKNNVRKFGAFQDLAMHLLVAAAVPAVAAYRVHDDAAADLAAGRIETDCAALESERPVNGVKVAAERIFNLRMSGIKLNNGFLSLGYGRKKQCSQSREDREVEWN